MNRTYEQEASAFRSLPVAPAVHVRFAGACEPEDAELFYATFGPALRSAKKICKDCPAIADCRSYAEQLEKYLPPKFWFGVWGGETAAERRARRNRRMSWERREDERRKMR